MGCYTYIYKISDCQMTFNDVRTGLIKEYKDVVHDLIKYKNGERTNELEWIDGWFDFAEYPDRYIRYFNRLIKLLSNPEFNNKKILEWWDHHPNGSNLSYIYDKFINKFIEEVKDETNNNSLFPYMRVKNYPDDIIHNHNDLINLLNNPKNDIHLWYDGYGHFKYKENFELDKKVISIIDNLVNDGKILCFA